MNFLFHIYLSKENPQEMIGNFLGDFVKKGEETLFSEEIQRGIILHRKIDSFANSNRIFLRSKKRFPHELRRFGAIAVDIVYDHFLARHFKALTGKELLPFTQDFYSLIEPLHPKPGRLGHIFPYLKNENWLYRYKDIPYIEIVLIRISKRFKRSNNLKDCFSVFLDQYDMFEKDFFEFLPEIEEFVRSQAFSQLSV